MCWLVLSQRLILKNFTLDSWSLRWLSNRAKLMVCNRGGINGGAARVHQL